MVIYFSGTGNSEYVAQRIAVGIGDQCANLFDRIKEQDTSPIYSDTPYVLVAPTYAWQLPKVLVDYLKSIEINGNKKLYIILTCGANIMGAPHYCAKFCEKIGMEYMGTTEVVMPENYIAMFKAPDKEEALEIIEKAEPKIDLIIKYINHNRPLILKSNPVKKSISAVLNKSFYKGFIKDKKFYVKDECLSCGLCASKCVKNNIEIVDGKPVWQGSCIHCMACINYCPVKAIEYGKGTTKKVRYTCPKKY